MTKEEMKKEAFWLGVVFILTLGAVIGWEYLFQLIIDVTGKVWSWELGSTLSEIIIIIPGLVYSLIKRDKIIELIQLRKMNFITFVYTCVVGIVIIPICSFINILSMFFVPNTFTSSAGTMLDSSSIVLMLVIAVVAPVFEEFAFRGIFANRYLKITSLWKAILISALMFGLAHMNFNQFLYATVLGMIFAILNRLTKTLASSVIAHFCVNFTNTALLILVQLAGDYSGEEIAGSVEEIRSSTAAMAGMACYYFVLAAGCLVLLIFMLKCIANECGTKDIYDEIFFFLPKKKDKNKTEEIIKEEESKAIEELGDDFAESAKKEHVSVWNISLIAGIVLGIAIMIYFQINMS